MSETDLTLYFFDKENVLIPQLEKELKDAFPQYNLQVYHGDEEVEEDNYVKVRGVVLTQEQKDELQVVIDAHVSNFENEEAYFDDLEAVRITTILEKSTTFKNAIRRIADTHDYDYEYEYEYEY